MPTEPSKYASNQFLSATVRSLPLMSELLLYTEPRLTLAESANSAFSGVMDTFNDANDAWNQGENALANARAGQEAATFAFESKMASLTRKPDPDTNSPVAAWDATIQTIVAYQGTTYRLLLPDGRTGLTTGTWGEQLDALQQFGIRLGQQTAHPPLQTIGTAVAAFFTAANALRTAQTGFIAQVDALSDAQELLRVQAAAALYGVVGFAMFTWSTTPEKVDSLFSVSLLRGPALVVPPAPADTLWAPATRTLSTTALPEGATRLEAWRLTAGGAPERIGVGEADEALVVIPPAILFTAGVSYQLWLVARNSKGSSPASPVQAWVGV